LAALQLNSSGDLSAFHGDFAAWNLRLPRVSFFALVAQEIFT
jgi:hypothetical protein